MSVHWWMAGCYLVVFIAGITMAKWPGPLPGGALLYDFHKSIGVLTMALLTWRILTLIQVIWKKYTHRLPKFSPAWIRNFILHGLMYVLMWAVPIAGFLLSNSYAASNVKFFGLVLPDIFPPNQAMIEVGRNLHFWLAYTFLVSIGLHMAVQRRVVKANWRRFVGFIKTKFA
jgi:cytochrome b561